MKIVSTLPIAHVLKLEGKLKPTEKKNLRFSKFSILFSVFQCTNHHQPISVANLGCNLNHVKLLISSCLQSLCF